MREKQGQAWPLALHFSPVRRGKTGMGNQQKANG